MPPKIRMIFITLLLGSGVLSSSCNEKVQRKEASMQERPIEEVLKDHTDEWMTIPGVVGTAIGKVGERKVIKVLLLEKTKEMEGRIPKTIEGYGVILEETGEIRAVDPE